MYGYSKHVFDLYAERTGLLQQIIGLKFFNVFGPKEYRKRDMASVVYKAFHQTKETGRVPLFGSCREDCADGEQKRNFAYVKDCVEARWWVLAHGEVNGLFKFGTGQARSWNEPAQAIFAALGRWPQIDFMPMPNPLREKYQYFTQANMARLHATAVRPYLLGIKI